MKCKHYLEQPFPCGQCINCRINRQSEKALRLNHELQYHQDNVFVTLTYSPEHLPEGNTLVKEDVQKFLKRVRKRLGDDHVRYFACGEYGENNDRPHYHLIIFGLSALDSRIFKDRHFVPGEGYRVSCEAWDKGFVTVDKVTTARVNYVTKYVLKKLTGKLGDEYYGDRLPEFSLCSRNPGLGYQYAIDHAYRIKNDDCCTVLGKKHPVPRYYVDKLYDDFSKRVRSSKREDEFLKQKDEKERPDFEKYGAFGYARLLQDKLATANEIMARKIQMKGKTKCQVD